MKETLYDKWGKSVNSIEEIFVEVENFPNYSVSTHGRVINNKKKKLLQYNIMKNGCARVDLCNKFGVKHFNVHRLVASTFIENKYNKEFVNHIDGNKTNNHINNLEWVTPAENTKHAIESGLFLIGENHPCAKLTNNIVKIIPIMFLLGGSRISLAQSLNVSKKTISNVLSKQTYSTVKINIDMKNTYLPRGKAGKLFSEKDIEYLLENTELIIDSKESITV